MGNYNSAKVLISQFAGQQNTIGVPRAFCKFMDSLEGGVFLSQVIYWSDKGKHGSGWFYKSYAEWEEETMLSQYKVNKYAEQLKVLGVLETQLRKANNAPTVHYRFDYEKFGELFVKFLEADNEKFDNPLSKIPQSITDTTADTTTDILEQTKNVCSDKPIAIQTTLPVEDKFTTTLTVMEDELLFDALNRNRKAQRQRAMRRQFDTLQQKEKWRGATNAAARLYNGRHTEMLSSWITAALEKGIRDKAGVIAYVAACAVQQTARKTESLKVY